MLLRDPELELVLIFFCGIELAAFESAVLELHKYVFATLILRVGYFRKCRAVTILAGYKRIGQSCPLDSWNALSVVKGDNLSECLLPSNSSITTRKARKPSCSDS